MLAFGFSSLLVHRVTRVERLENDVCDEVEELTVETVEDSMVDVAEEVIDERRDCDLEASRRGIIMRTCWQTRREDRNLEI